LVAALTLGSALPHLIAFLGGTDWRAVILTTSLCAALSGCAMLFILLGPHHQRAGSFQPRAIVIAFADPAIRRAYFGYFGHMWELYAFWAWVGTMAALAALEAGLTEPAAFGSLIAFCAIALGGLATVPAGAIADRIGKAPVAGTALLGSGLFGVAAALTFGGPLWLFAGVLILWGIAVIPDSAQLSAMVADAAPPQYAGSIMTLQNAIGFALSAISVELTPVLAQSIGWPLALLVLVAGPAMGIAALARRVG
ncbi:MAG: MFS transporter, partial [Pseudomonadota bacterium]